MGFYWGSFLPLFAICLIISLTHAWLLPCFPDHERLILTQKYQVWSCLVAIQTVLTHLTEHLVAKIYCWKMLRRGQFFRDIIYQCLTWPTPNIHSLLPLSINCNTAGRRGDVTQDSGSAPTLSHTEPVHSKLTSIIRHRGRPQPLTQWHLTNLHSTHSDAPLTSHEARWRSAKVEGRFFHFISDLCNFNFHPNWEATMPYFVFYWSWSIKSQDHCQDQFPLLIAFNELLENISCVSFQRLLDGLFPWLCYPVLMKNDFHIREYFYSWCQHQTSPQPFSLLYWYLIDIRVGEWIEYKVSNYLQSF